MPKDKLATPARVFYANRGMHNFTKDQRADIKRARQKCLALLRDMRPIRKSMSQVPESVCDALRNQAQRYLDDIQDFRKELGELA